ncbi:MAG: hypothetical protein WC890_07790 [Candidatus Margulisiibacteriota bacterium]
MANSIEATLGRYYPVLPTGIDLNNNSTVEENERLEEDVTFGGYYPPDLLSFVDRNAAQLNRCAKEEIVASIDELFLFLDDLKPLYNRTTDTFSQPLDDLLIDNNLAYASYIVESQNPANQNSPKKIIRAIKTYYENLKTKVQPKRIEFNYSPTCQAAGFLSSLGQTSDPIKQMALAKELYTLLPQIRGEAIAPPYIAQEATYTLANFMQNLVINLDESDPNLNAIKTFFKETLAVSNESEPDWFSYQIALLEKINVNLLTINHRRDLQLLNPLRIANRKKIADLTVLQQAAQFTKIESACQDNGDCSAVFAKPALLEKILTTQPQLAQRAILLLLDASASTTETAHDVLNITDILYGKEFNPASLSPLPKLVANNIGNLQFAASFKAQVALKCARFLDDINNSQDASKYLLLAHNSTIVESQEALSASPYQVRLEKIKKEIVEAESFINETEDVQSAKTMLDRIKDDFNTLRRQRPLSPAEQALFARALLARARAYSWGTNRVLLESHWDALYAREYLKQLPFSSTEITLKKWRAGRLATETAQNYIRLEFSSFHASQSIGNNVTNEFTNFRPSLALRTGFLNNLNPSFAHSPGNIYFTAEFFSSILPEKHTPQTETGTIGVELNYGGLLAASYEQRVFIAPKNDEYVYSLPQFYIPAQQFSFSADLSAMTHYLPLDGFVTVGLDNTTVSYRQAGASLHPSKFLPKSFFSIIDIALGIKSLRDYATNYHSYYDETALTTDLKITLPSKFQLGAGVDLPGLGQNASFNRFDRIDYRLSTHWQTASGFFIGANGEWAEKYSPVTVFPSLPTFPLEAVSLDLSLEDQKLVPLQQRCWSFYGNIYAGVKF